MGKRFCFFDYNINFGGAPAGSISLCSRLRQSGEDVIIYDVYGKNEKYLSRIYECDLPVRIVYGEATKVVIGGQGRMKRFASFLSQLPSFLRIIMRTRSLLKKDGVSLVWVNNSKSLATVIAASIGLNVKKIVYHRGWAEPDSIGWFFRTLIYTQCSALVAHSYATVSNLREIFPRKKVVYVPNSVSLKNSLSKLKKEYRSEDFILLLPAARPVREKGHHIALEALREVLDKTSRRVRLRFPGEIPVGVDGSYFSYLHELMRKLGIESQVDFLGWLDDLEEELVNADVVILPSSTEGFPRVVIEAMLLGTPVVATPVGGIPEAIIHGETGFLVGLDDASDLASAIIQCMESPDLLKKIVLEASASATLKFSAKAQVDGIRKVFYEVLDGE